jgi:hypothetical protein
MVAVKCLGVAGVLQMVLACPNHEVEGLASGAASAAGSPSRCRCRCRSHFATLCSQRNGNVCNHWRQWAKTSKLMSTLRLNVRGRAGGTASLMSQYRWNDWKRSTGEGSLSMVQHLESSSLHGDWTKGASGWSNARMEVEISSKRRSPCVDSCSQPIAIARPRSPL